VNNYYTAKLCKEHINANYKKDDKFIEGYGNLILMNNRTGTSADMTLDKLDKLLTTEYVDGLLSREMNSCTAQMVQRNALIKCSVRICSGQHGVKLVSVQA
jgi:hypothetical protein